MTTITRQNQLHSLAVDGPSPGKKASNGRKVDKISELASEFESIFLNIVLKSMRDAVPKSEFIDGGNGEQIFRSMLDDEYAKQMAQQRTSGLADSIERHLRGVNQPVERSSLGAEQMAGMRAYLNSLE